MTDTVGELVADSFRTNLARAGPVMASKRHFPSPVQRLLSGDFNVHGHEAPTPGMGTQLPFEDRAGQRHWRSSTEGPHPAL